MESVSRIKGSLLAGALGDALGYAVEFVDYESIVRRYGNKGITSMNVENGIALISDDTQMTLFTADALREGKKDPVQQIYRYYLDWLGTQAGWETLTHVPESKLCAIKELNSWRAPGNTCLSALSSGVMGRMEMPINDSKGCGGVMRVAPIGLYYGNRDIKTKEEVCEIGAQTAAITHDHELGYIPAYCMTNMLYRIMKNMNTTIEDMVSEALHDTCIRFSDAKFIAYFQNIMETAAALAKNDVSDVENIHEIGGGWVGEEALAIAVYCFMRYPNDVQKALIAAVNHSGDSDSTGAIAGNLIGAYLGEQALPEAWLRVLELRSVIAEVAQGLE